MVVLLLALLVTTSFSIAEPNNVDETGFETVINITVSSNYTIGEDYDYIFLCDTESGLNISLYIDGSMNSSKLSRINSTGCENETEFVFGNVSIRDNGTIFMCSTTKDNHTYNTSTLTLQVYTAPIFKAGVNDSQYLYIEMGSNSSDGSCSILYANPPVKSIILTNDSGKTDNVHFKKDGVIMFENATLGNRGNYTCEATNEIGSSYLNYETFVGGAPNNVSLNITSAINSNSTVMLIVNVTDYSTAPAQYVIIGFNKTYGHLINFTEHLPIMGAEFKYPSGYTSQQLLYANYTLFVKAVNKLGNTTLEYNPVFINGAMSLEVGISEFTDNTTVGDNYTFACETVPDGNFNVSFIFDVLIENGGNDSHERLIKEESEQSVAQIYTFTDVTYEDIDVTFTCIVNNKYMSNGTNMTLFYAPIILSDVEVDTKTVGDPGFTIELNFTSNPPLRVTEWYHNGQPIINNTNIVIWFDTITFYSLTSMDNGTYTAILYNEIGNATVEFDMNVLYAPILSIGNEVGGFLDQPLTVTVTVDANPPINSSNWLINGQPLHDRDDITITSNSIEFTKLSSKDIANYTLHVKNGIGNGTEITFELLAYDGPYFKQGPSNSSSLTEHKTGADFNLSCQVTKSEPPIHKLYIEPANGSNWRTVTNKDDHIVTVVITNATASLNTINYTCIAMNNATTAHLKYNTFVGGAPNNVKVTVSVKHKDNTVILTANVTDSSAVPVTNVSFTIKGKNITVPIPNPPLYGRTVTLKDVYSASFQDLGFGKKQTVKIYAVNMISSKHVTDYHFTVPDQPKNKKSSHAGAIAAGIIVPLAVIAFIVVGIVAFFYYWKKRRAGYSFLQETDPVVNISSTTPDYNTNKVIT